MTMPRQETVATGRSAAGSLRTGAEYLRSLNDGRQVFLDGERVADVSQHLAFREAARSVARLYDIAAAPENRELMTFPSPATGAPVLRAFQIPRNHADLRARRLCSEKWAEATFGLMGRSPDHVAGFFTGYAAVPAVFAKGGQRFADNVVAFYEKMRDEHLYVSYAIVPPQIDRIEACAQTERSDALRRRGQGTRRRHRDLRRAAGGNRRRAVGLDSPELHPSAPAGRRELRQLPRCPGQCAGRQAAAASAVCAARRQFLRLPAVEPVRRDRLLTWCSITYSCRGSMCSSIAISKLTPRPVVEDAVASLGNHQAQVRYVTKLRFMMGLAQRMVEMIGNAPGRRRCRSRWENSRRWCRSTRACCWRTRLVRRSRTACCGRRVITLYSAMAMQSEFNGRMLEMVRELVGSSVISLPSSRRRLRQS